VPDNQNGPAGPFDYWPTRIGFDYFYGFVGGETDQFCPALVPGTTAVKPPATPDQGSHLTRDLATIALNGCACRSPLPQTVRFLPISRPVRRTPHQPPLNWRGQHKGRFDMGWDAYREQTYRRQLELGVIPKGTQLTPRPEQIPAWADASAEAKKLFSRFAENYADFLAHTDYEVGRLVAWHRHALARQQ
jgi:arylsulfatase